MTAKNSLFLSNLNPHFGFLESSYLSGRIKPANIKPVCMSAPSIYCTTHLATAWIIIRPVCQIRAGTEPAEDDIRPAGPRSSFWLRVLLTLRSLPVTLTGCAVLSTAALLRWWLVVSVWRESALNRSLLGSLSSTCALDHCLQPKPPP